MLFNSYIFIFAFLPIALLIFFLLNRFRFTKLAIIALTLSSLFFYSYWNLFPPEGQAATPEYLLLIIFSIGVNYQIGKTINDTDSKTQRKLLLILGIILNLSLIAYYKYANFLLDSINHLLPTHFHIPELVLPLGISFYTFTQTAYLVDSYREAKGIFRYSFVTYALFILFFPHLIAGPIVRHNELIPQFRQLKRFVFSHKNFALGLTIFSIGLAKKVIIADNIAPWVSPIFSHAAQVTFIEAWVGALAYTFQLYFDFSGYSDMAIGLGLMFNFILPINFNSPYKATSISDFWRRWHISLSNFLRDYLYIPLGGSRRGEIRRYGNLILTMLLGGLWHGAGWTFVVWGGLHGVYLSLNHAWRKLNIPLPKVVAWGITFLAVIFSWVLFRSHSFADSMEMIKAMIGMKGIVLPGEAQGKLAFLSNLGIQLKSWRELTYIPQFFGKQNLSLLVLIGLTFAVALLPNTQDMMEKFKPNLAWAVGAGVLASVCLLSLNRFSEFLYFQF